jgi:hypothetical protein
MQLNKNVPVQVFNPSRRLPQVVNNVTSPGVMFSNIKMRHIGGETPFSKCSG